jgi:hypothetical protein
MFEAPKERRARKAKEFRMAAQRTLWSNISGVAAVISVILSLLIFAKVWLP